MSREDFFTAEEIRKLRSITLGELKELIRDLDSLLLKLRDPAEIGAASERLRHIFHTVGGSAALAGFEAIGDVGSGLESLIEDSIRDGSFSPEVIERITSASEDLIKRIGEKETGG